MRILPSLLCAAVLLSSARAQEQPKVYPLYPLAKGAKWTYKAGMDTTIVVVVKGSTKIKTDDQYEVETTGPDGTKNEHIIVTADGAFRTAVGNMLVTPVAMCFFKFPPEMKPGQPPPEKPEKPKPVSWTVDCKVGPETVKGTFTLGEAEIEIDKMKYKTVTVNAPELLVNNKKVNLTYYYAENVGLVKGVVKAEGVELSMVLVKYEPPKQ